MECQICNNNYFKYRCPICQIKYCSVDCFCNHKGSCAISEDVNTGANPSKEKSNQEFQFPTEDTVPKEKLEKLAESQKLKALLSNPHLRDMLQALGAAVNKEKAMQAAMLEPIFTEYADMVLEIVGEKL
ncbi:zinc finger HIT domain-containing protein 3-like [Artemia franciscana]|uniref:HIT-type domain-containing protein n=1 Tax=Artemia franciscana TaxID=6661 RepID=A0AA88I1N2_ARTSF|nr:hypothetical protein QYM36_008866 [Artemia franciscana]